MKQLAVLCGLALSGNHGRFPAPSRRHILGKLLVACGLVHGVLFPAHALAATSPLPNDPLCLTPLGGKQGPGTIRMVMRLQEIQRLADPRESAYLSEQMVERCRLAKSVATNAPQRAFAQTQYALQLLRSGHSEESVREFEELNGFLNECGLRVTARDRAVLELQQGVAYLRMGEQDNCLLDHNSDSCLLPIQGAGIHKQPRGSRGAIGIFGNMLRQRPDDLAARWLLNIAHMTLGQYPEQVPASWLIPPSVFASGYDLPRFPEAAAAAGLDVDDLAGGCITEDFDGDGLLDVMASAWSLRGQLRLFHNNGDGTFAERTREAGLQGLTGSLNILQTDYNNDGHADVFLLRGAWLGNAGHHPNSLLRNNGDGTFEDVTEQAGLLSFHPTQTATWFDFDGDGWLDVFIGNESSGDDVNPCELYRNNGDGTFTECASSSGVALVAFVKGVTSGDYDNDGRPDLYVSCRNQYNVLLRNEGAAAGHSNAQPKWRFADVTERAGVREPLASFPCWFFDYDNDGRLDIFVTGYSATVREIAADYLGLPHQADRARLYRNNGNGTFADVTRAAGLYKVMHGMGANFGDFDNDGWLDFYVGTGDPDLATLAPNRAFRNNGGTNFQEVTSAGGFGHLQKGHGIAFADLDNNGSQDVYAVMGGAFSGDNYRNALFVNPGNSNHWVAFKLEGVSCNRAAIGARIRVVVETDSGQRSIYKTVCSGGSFGASPLRQEFGLGAARSIHSVEIFWPVTGQTQVFRSPAMDRFYRIREGQSEVAPWPLKRFQLATKADPAKPGPTKHQHSASLNP